MASNPSAPFLSSHAGASEVDDVEALAGETIEEMSSIPHRLGGSASTPATTTDYRKRDRDEIADLESKARALALTPLPDYLGSIDEENLWLEEEYGDRFLFDDDDDDDEDDDGGEAGDAVEDEELVNDPSGIVLAVKTTQILGNFEDYVSWMGGLFLSDDDDDDDDDAGDAGDAVEDEELENDPSGIVLAAKTKRILSNFEDYVSWIRGESHRKDILAGGGGVGKEGEALVQSESNVSDGSGDGRLLREWSRDGYAPKNGAGQNLHGLRFEGGGMVQRGQKYTHPLLHSRKVRFGLLNCIVITTIVLAVGLGVSNRNSKSAQELDAQIGELEEELAKSSEDEKDDNGWSLQHTPLPSQGRTENDNSKISSSEPTPPPTPSPSNKPTVPTVLGALGATANAYKIAETYNPMWYDRSSGWTGQTYDEAFTFCSGKGSNHDICPYEVICPGGPLNQPYGGSGPEPSGSAWAPINKPFNSWVQVGDREVCVLYKNMNPDDHPTWGLTGIDDEYLTRRIACCDMDSAEAHVESAYGSVMEKYEPRWFNSDGGWSGETYEEAIEFCASQDSSIPCPYEAYCPMGPGSVPTLGDSGPEESWAAIMDVPNGWVQVGSYVENSISTSCVEYNFLHKNPPMWGLLGGARVLTPRIMCCKEPENGVIGEIDFNNVLSVTTAKTKNEQDILEEMTPVWFRRRHGYHGTSLAEASDFCKTIGDMVLCPRSAYCPGAENELFLEKDPFEGEQWAPVASELDKGDNYWISVGTAHGTCSTFEELHLSTPEWSLDGSRQDLKENILCCQNPKFLPKEESLMKDLSPIWMDASHGWNGGSHDDAAQFCEDFGNRKICPYTAYCPRGPGQSVMGGHASDFNTEGEQWAPIYGAHNPWVMIGQKYQNRATTCMDSRELEWGIPDWGTLEESASLQKYIMCCSF